MSPSRLAPSFLLGDEMTTAVEIAEHFDFNPSGSDSFTGDCPSCGYRGFSVTQKNERTLFYCHGGGCSAQEIISALKDVGLWGANASMELLEPLDDDGHARSAVPPASSAHRDAAIAMFQRSQSAEATVVETYLRARGYHGIIPTTLQYVRGKHPSDGAIHPIMLGLAYRWDCSGSFEFVGVHRTFLAPDGTGKAALDPNKMSLGNIRGAAIALGPIATKLAVSEGIETGLSFMQATGIPTWAALSAGGLQTLILPPEVREVLIAADPDPVGLKAARVAAQRWHDEGRIVRIVQPPEGTDFNDLARAS